MNHTLVLKRSALMLLSMFVLVILSYFFLDIRVATLFHNLPQDWFYTISNAFFYPYMGTHVWVKVSIIGLIISFSLYYFTKKKNASKIILYVSSSMLVAYVITGGLKYLLGRYRPVEYFDHQLYGFHYLTSKWSYTSMPSGHAAITFALCSSLIYLIKQWWATILLFTFAICCGISRVWIGHHYVSDVIAGAYIGILAAYWSRAVFTCYQKKRV